MNGNPYFEDGERYATEATEINAWPRGEREVLATNGQALATLALAYEQRTANLFAYWDTMTDGADIWADTPFQSEMDSIQRDIRTRMGIAPEVAK